VHPENTCALDRRTAIAGKRFRPSPEHVLRYRTAPDGPRWTVDQVFTLTTPRVPVPVDPLNPRIVNVSDVSGLSTALQGAQPGDIITLAMASTTSEQSISTVSGTAQKSHFDSRRQ